MIINEEDNTPALNRLVSLLADELNNCETETEQTAFIHAALKSVIALWVYKGTDNAETIEEIADSFDELHNVVGVTVGNLQLITAADLNRALYRREARP
jgi:hypothetical protein